MKRVIDALGGLLIGVLGAGGIVLLAAGPIMNLPGKVDSNNALVVASVAAGSIGSQGSPIANLPGKVDANNALVVTMAANSEITGPFTLTQNSLGTTSTTGYLIRNQTAAAAGAQQYSPRSCWEGQGWKTDATAATQSVVFCMETQPVQGASAPTGNFVLKASINGGAFSTVGTFTSGGQLQLPAGSAAVPALASSANPATGLYWTGANTMGFSSNGTFGVQFNTSGVLDLMSNASQLRFGAAQDTLISRNGAAGALRFGTSSNTYDITLADWGTLMSPEGISMANTDVLFMGTSRQGELTIINVEDQRQAKFLLYGAGNVTVEMTAFDPSDNFSITKDTASKINVYYDAAGASGAGYYIQNNRGGTRTVRSLLIGS
jgi:hypothetical protein